MSTVLHIFHASKVKVQPYVVLRIRDLAPSTPDKASSESCGELSATNKSAQWMVAGVIWSDILATGRLFRCFHSRQGMVW